MRHICKATCFAIKHLYFRNKLVRYAKSQERIWKTRVLHTFPPLSSAATVATSVEHLIYHFPAHGVAHEPHMLAQLLITGSESVTMGPLHIGRTEPLLFTNCRRTRKGVIHKRYQLLRNNRLQLTLAVAFSKV
jgi:hypothetical protein